MISFKRFLSIVFDEIVLLAVLGDHMNVIMAKHVNFTKPFDGMIEGKVIPALFDIAIDIASNFKHLKLLLLAHINNSHHEVFLITLS